MKWQTVRGSIGRTKAAAAVTLAVALAFLCGCAAPGRVLGPTQPRPSDAKRSDVVLATTTVVRDSGLADAMKSAFEGAYPQYRIRIADAGVGASRQGNGAQAGVALVDAVAKNGLDARSRGAQSKLAMLTDFVLVGPSDDPAGAAKSDSAAGAFKAIAATKRTFASVGDDSSVRAKEASLWAQANVSTKGKPWHLVSSDSTAALTTAAAKGGYTLVFKASWLAAKPSLKGLRSIRDGGEALVDTFETLIPGVRVLPGASVLENWITGPAGQGVIGGFGVREFGQSVFKPIAPMVSP